MDRRQYAMLWALLQLSAACADRATIAALCPPGCVPLAHESVCDCSASVRQDAALPEAERDAAISCERPGCADAATPGAQCVAGAFNLSRKRQDLLVVADDDTTLGFWWPVLSEGFFAFVQEQGSYGMGVGLWRFGASCESADYEQPVVPIATLPDNLSALQQSFPVGGSITNSTVPALTGVLAYARRWALDHPDALTSVLLITDASPGACDGAAPGGYPAAAARIATEAYAGSPSLKTYWLGGGGLGLIEDLARAGGTQAYTIAPLQTSDAVLAALRAIRSDAATSCALALPEGRTLAPDSRVLVRAKDGSEQSYAIERGASSCERDVFYVPDETASHPLIACPRVCAAIAGSAGLTLSSACGARP